MLHVMEIIDCYCCRLRQSAQHLNRFSIYLNLSQIFLHDFQHRHIVGKCCRECEHHVINRWNAFICKLLFCQHKQIMCCCRINVTCLYRSFNSRNLKCEFRQTGFCRIHKLLWGSCVFLFCCSAIRKDIDLFSIRRLHIGRCWHSLCGKGSWKQRNRIVLRVFQQGYIAVSITNVQS